MKFGVLANIFLVTAFVLNGAWSSAFASESREASGSLVQWQLDTSSAELVHGREGGSSFVVESPRVYPSSGDRLPLLTADAAWFSGGKPRLC
jgi:hypothetical protein